MRTNKYIKASDWVPIAERIAARHDGILPNPQALIVAGYWALYQQMRRNPGLFNHIRQERVIPRRTAGHVNRLSPAQSDRVGDAQTGSPRDKRSFPSRPTKLAPTYGRGAWVRMLVQGWRHGQLYRTDLPARVLLDRGIQHLVFKPPGRKQAALVVRKTPRLVAWLQALPRRHKGKIIGPFNIDTHRQCLSR